MPTSLRAPAAHASAAAAHGVGRSSSESPSSDRVARSSPAGTPQRPFRLKPQLSTEPPTSRTSVKA